MVVACQVVAIVWTCAFFIVVCAMCWQSPRRFARLPIRSTERCAQRTTRCDESTKRLCVRACGRSCVAAAVTTRSSAKGCIAIVLLSSASIEICMLTLPFYIVVLHLVTSAVCRLYSTACNDAVAVKLPRWFPAFAWHDARDLYTSRLFPRRGTAVLAALHATVLTGVVLVTIFEWTGASAIAPYGNYGAKLTNWCAATTSVVR
jgi:hypothetical protein